MPQLFARLNHPVDLVRDTLCTILERIAVAAPHALCYPAIVGATQPIVIHSSNTADSGTDMDDLIEVEERKMRAEQVHSCFFFYFKCLRVVSSANNFPLFGIFFFFDLFETFKFCQDRSLMVECCERIVDHMKRQYPKLVLDVTHFVKVITNLLKIVREL